MLKILFLANSQSTLTPFKYADHERDDGRRANIDGHTTDNHYMYDDREDNVDVISIAE